LEKGIGKPGATTTEYQNVYEERSCPLFNDALTQNTKNIPLSKLASDKGFLGNEARSRTGAYFPVHEDSSTESTTKSPSVVEFRKRSIILAIESSCDDTSAAIITDKKEILSNIVVSQLAEHSPYSGVVPEIAARAHMGNLKAAIQAALKEANLGLADIDAFAATAGPGLIGGVIVGTMFAKSMASVNKKPYIAVNHLEGHALTARLCSNLEYPFLLLLISGGHCQFIAVEQLGKYKILGQTLDDAVGEAFDKVAKMLGLGYPGGPIIEKLALNGDPKAYSFPLSMVGRENCDMSFSGLKTAVRKTIQEHAQPISQTEVNNICASFQHTVAKILSNRVEQAIKIYQAQFQSRNFVLAGGVAANMYLRQALETTLNLHGFSLYAPPLKLCTDNAAMIGWAAMERFQANLTSSLDFCPRARWSLEDI
jgi:N6-L-threonylcarbamoyladenine synthase